MKRSKPPPQKAPAATAAAVAWWHWAGLALVFVLGALLGWRQIASPDIGFHLSSGRWIVEHWTVPLTDPFSFTMNGHPYLDLQWLFQLLLYGAHQLGGTGLILAVKILLVSAFWGLLLARAWRSEGRLPAASTFLLLLFALGHLWEERPHLLSWVFGSAVFWIMEEFNRGNRRWLPALPVILLLWVNTHSLFVLGLVIIGVHVLWDIRRGRNFDRRLLACAIASGLVCFANPYGAKGLLLPLIQFRDISGAQVFKSPLTGTAEYQSPFQFGQFIHDGRFVLFQPCLYWLLYTALAVTGAAFVWRRGRVPEFVLAALFLYVFWKANKNFGYFVMATFPLAAGGLDEAGRRLLVLVRRHSEGVAKNLPTTARVAIASVALVACALTWNGKLYQLEWNPHRPGTGFNAAFLPVGACEFINRHRLEGRVWNTFGHGGYIHWATRLPVSIYGIAEVVGPKFYEEYIASKEPANFPEQLKRWQPTLAIVPFRDAPFWLYHLNTRADWRLVFHDEDTALFLHQSVGGDIPRLEPPVPGKDFPRYRDTEIAAILHAAADRPAMTWRHWWQGRDALPLREMTLSGFYLHTGQVLPCISTALQGLERSPVLVPELFLNLGHAFESIRRHDLADACFDTFLRANRDPQLARDLGAVRSARRLP